MARAHTSTHCMVWENCHRASPGRCNLYDMSYICAFPARVCENVNCAIGLLLEIELCK